MPGEKKDSVDQEIYIEEKKIMPNGEVFVKKYVKGRFLGKQIHLIRCTLHHYREDLPNAMNLLESIQSKPYAAKLISKSSLTKSRARQKLLSEIKIHRSLKHKHVVGFEHFFEDHDNVYILLELCSNQTLNEILKRRKRLHEIEIQAYVVQMVSALKYLHSHRVIHRDLKLGNLFINDKMEIKIGDFGLATKLEFEGDRKRTICGTPNYIAPEVLDGKNGHSYEVDVWSLGVIIYTLLIGKPPYETSDVKTTYKKIRMNSYTFPEHIKISKEVKSLISSILNLDPAKRPSLTQILEHEFFHIGVAIPKTLPSYTLACPLSESFVRKFMKGEGLKDSKSGAATARITEKQGISDAGSSGHKTVQGKGLDLKKLDKLKHIKSVESEGDLDVEIVEIIKNDVYILEYVDYSSKYGVGYLLSNKTFGVHFNDSSKIIFNPIKESIEYINNKNSENTSKNEMFTLKDYPSQHKKKVVLLQHFQGYLEANYQKKKKSVDFNFDENNKDKSVYVKKWMRTKHAIIFRLSNRIIQVIFFDQTEIILHSESHAITYINKKGNKLYYSIEASIESNNEEMNKRLSYTRQMLTHMLQPKFGSNKFQSSSDNTEGIKEVNIK